MAVREQLAALGWCLSAEGLEQLTEGGQIQDVSVLAAKALDLDLRDVGEAAFPEDFTKEPSKLEQQIVVQIQKIRNVSAPKANEESRHAPRMLKLTLHDGKTSCTGVEIKPLPNLSINTPPGTKVLLHNEGLQVQQGVVLLEPEVLTVLGGRVQHMIDKWELNRSLAKHTRGVSVDGGPPPWIAFGQRLEEQVNDKTFKSIQEASKQDNAEFEAQRKGAIAEAQRLAGTKKVFGGGNKPLLDANVQRIVDAGFSEEQADNALKFAKNNVERALRSLQRRDGSENSKKDKNQKEAEPPKRKGRSKENNDDDAVTVKPSGKVSLFDFLEDKLPNVPDRDKTTRPPSNFGRDDRNDRNDRNERNERNFSGRERNNPKFNNRQGGKYDPSKYRDGHGRNFSQDGPASRDGARDDRKYQQHPHERPPRFQRKLEENNRRNQASHSNYDSYSSSYPAPNSHGHGQYGGRTEHNERPRQTYGPSPVDTLSDIAADLSLASPSPNAPHISEGVSYHNRESQYSVKPTYQSTTLQGSIGADGMTYRRNAVPPDMPKYQEPYRQSQMNGYMEPPPPVYSNYMPSQQGAYHNGRQGFPYAQRTTDTYGGGGRPAYLTSNIVAFQNPAVNEQARSVLGAGDNLHWNVGDRCLALYWEDNNFYEAEVTGTSANTVVVKFCAYGNHEEVLKTNCLPYPSQGTGSYRAAAPVYAPGRP